jgi:hypothetical protein
MRHFSLAFLVVAAAALIVTPASAGAATFSNEELVEIPGSGHWSAAPYPSSINVKGMPGAVLRVRVGFGSMGHSEPDEIDALLVGPRGQHALLMSDACGGETILNVFFAFDDSAASPLSDTGPCPGGLYMPTNYSPGASDPLADAFPPPAPPPGGAFNTALSVFNGTDPNGVWNLFAVDDGNTGRGGIIGWSIQIHIAARCKGQPATLVGANDRDDLLIGTKQRDVIVGLSGDDLVRGKGGNDLICAGKGKDKLQGGKGKDTCIGGKGRDSASKCEIEKSI